MPFTLDSSGVDRNVPTAAAGANNGTGPPAPVVNPASDDTRGTITFGSGSTPAAGAQVVVTFSRPRDTNRLPCIQLTETTTATAALNPAITAISATGFTLSTNSAPTASQGNTIYGFTWTLAD